MRKVIRDPLHGYIELDELARAILDTVEMQRLRRIRQLGFSYLVYPGANHTRFEHSLGTYHLMNILLERLNVAKEEEQELIVASLIHDTGHGPYSHVTEPLIKKLTDKGHEEIESIIFADRDEDEDKDKDEDEDKDEDAESAATTILKVVEDYRLDKREIVRYIKGIKGENGERQNFFRERDFSRILNGEIDIDKMDYLVRDSYYTGVAYGIVDNIRLIQGLDFFKGEVVITEKGLLPAEYLLFSRLLMQPTVYNHHTSRIAQLMFLNALEDFIESDTAITITITMIRRMDDSELNIALRNANSYQKKMMRRINERRLFKRAVYRKINEMEDGLVEELSDERRVEEVREEISRRAGVDKKYVIVDFQEPQGWELEEGAAKVVIGNEFRSLRDVSSMVSQLSHAFRENYKIGVYTPEEHRAEVKRVSEGILLR